MSRTFSNIGRTDFPITFMTEYNAQDMLIPVVFCEIFVREAYWLVNDIKHNYVFYELLPDSFHARVMTLIETQFNLID